jgi:hypothetical protein
MSSLKTSFNDLMEKIKQGREFGHSSFEPIFYLVFLPNQILQVKQETTTWISRLKNEGWDVSTFSIAEHVADIFANANMRNVWLAGDKKAPLAWEKTNSSLSNAISKGALQQRIEAKLASMEGKPKAILLVTDLEALHPYMRIGVIEGQLQGKFTVPTVFLYPGIRTGKTRLKFLGFYPDDGNYRSVHVGG